MSTANKTTNIIFLTEAAKDELKRLNITTTEFLRIEIMEGGCSGLMYDLWADKNQDSHDQVLFDDDEVKIVSQRGNVANLIGLEIDYSDDLINMGFRFNNPNAVSTCGCGQSMAL